MAKKSMILKQQAKPKFSTRAYNRCKICGRPHAYLRDFGICRICFRELAYKGQIRVCARLPGKSCADRNQGFRFHQERRAFARIYCESGRLARPLFADFAVFWRKARF